MDVGNVERGDLTETPERTVERLVLRVDPGERGSALVELVERHPLFDVRVIKLQAGDYGIGDEILIERKAYRDLEARSSMGGFSDRPLGWLTKRLAA